jgi:pyrroloquinoline quinone (PQQ) biosynthesis protein C
MTVTIMEDVVHDASDKLASCDALQDVHLLEDCDFYAILLQRRFLSLAFTPFYDVVIDALDDDVARVVCRQILREEYPDEGGNKPSHRELLVDDLQSLGVSLDAVRRTRPTPATQRAITTNLDLIPIASADQHSQIAVITTALVTCESFVSAEYEALRPAIDKRMSIAETVFYGPHLEHDCGHAKRLLDIVRRLMREGDRSQVDAFERTVERCLEARLAFYSQFTGVMARP